MSTWGLPLARFVGDMAEALEDNDHKGGWEGMSALGLLHRLRLETNELEAAIRRPRSDLFRWQLIQKESADAANFCMMIADLAREAEEEANAEVLRRLDCPCFLDWREGHRGPSKQHATDAEAQAFRGRCS